MNIYCYTSIKRMYESTSIKFLEKYGVNEVINV
jgi:hypothetical protein